jgi:hypothetical protein
MADESSDAPLRGVVIPVARARGSWRTEESVAAVRNDASTVREWILEETAWLLGQFVKVALSVVAFRGIQQLFRSRLANESTYRRAPDLWNHGHRDSEQRKEDVRPAWSGTSTTTFTDRARTQSSSDSGSVNGTASGSPKYIASIEGHHLYLHARRLQPAQQWPCPILADTPCRTCSFLEYDSGGAGQCIMVWKMRAVIHGLDGGESLDDVRDWIRNS